MNGLSPNGARRVYRLLCHVAAANGEVGPEELTVLSDFRKTNSIPEAEARELERQGRRAEGLRLSQRQDEQAALIEAMIDLMVADGEFDDFERLELLRLAERFGLHREKLEARIEARLVGFDLCMSEESMNSSISYDLEESLEASSEQPAAPTSSEASDELELNNDPADLPSPRGIRRIYRALCSLAAADGLLTVSSARVLDRYCQSFGIPNEEARRLSAEAMATSRFKFSRDPNERSVLRERVLALIAASGHLGPRAGNVLGGLRRSLELSAAELVTAIQTRLPTQSRVEIEASLGLRRDS